MCRSCGLVQGPRDCAEGRGPRTRHGSRVSSRDHDLVIERQGRVGLLGLRNPFDGNRGGIEQAGAVTVHGVLLVCAHYTKE